MGYSVLRPKHSPKARPRIPSTLGHMFNSRTLTFTIDDNGWRLEELMGEMVVAAVSQDVQEDGSKFD